MIIYIATQKESKILNIYNHSLENQKSVVFINDITFDDVTMVGAFDSENPAWRVLDLNLNEGDVVSALDNELVTYTIS